ncbi:hypothetical protein J5289_18230 [Rhizobium sp. B230/85]|uniref:hypothetical protein n=1 Tax=unclassified Rhizobium TaxID=2613769 RepID=UPI001AD9B961|nr:MULTISPECIES: hypothetical protein [unclassified Rhizobium]MBO9136544.1 hypothetical protein [Rhizobium sp. B209b/85]QXZ98542.1 hypothetical protein J5289_18230 [Rhizobium sp. B230/85]
MIKPPNDNPRDDDLECQQALEASFLKIIDEAVAAGWSRRLVLQSLGDLADNLWIDEEKLGPEPQLPAVGNFDP